MMSMYEHLRDFYNKTAVFYDDHRIPVGVDVIVGMIYVHSGKPLKDVQILDAGCGPGQQAKQLLEYGLKRITLLDFSSEMLGTANLKLMQEIESGLVEGIVKATLPEMPFTDDSFDVVLLIFVLHHVETRSDGNTFPDTMRTLKEACRVLRKCGLLFMTVLTPYIEHRASWLLKVFPTHTRSLTKQIPSMDQWDKILPECNYSCLAKIRMLGPEVAGDWYSDPEGLLRGNWRNSFPNWMHATEDEIQDMEKNIRNMITDSTLETRMKENDKTNELGLYTILVCKAI